MGFIGNMSEKMKTMLEGAQIYKALEFLLSRIKEDNRSVNWQVRNHLQIMNRMSVNSASMEWRPQIREFKLISKGF